MSKIWLVIKREYLTRVKKKSFIIMTLLGPLLMAGVIALITYLGMGDSTPQNILVVDDMAPVFSNLEDGNNYKFSYLDISLEDAQNMFKDSDFTAILWIPGNLASGNDRAFLYFKSQPSGRVIRSIENKVEVVVEQLKMRKYNVDPEAYAKVRTNFKIDSYKFNEAGKAEKVMEERTIVGFFFSILIYMFIFMYGIQVMKGVIEEKSNRIIEVIITSIKPFQLMMGKILGIAMVGLTQFLLWIILMFTFVTVAQTVIMGNNQEAMIAAQMEMVDQTSQMQSGAINMNNNSNPFDITDPDNLINRINWPLMIGLFIFYFLGGYLLYAALFAAIGAAVDNETDTQQFMLPVTAPLLAAYFISAMMMDNPESPAALWGSIIPFTSPIVMMVRVSLGIESSDYWELALSMTLLIIGFLATTWLAAKIYRVGILMYGKKITYKELWKWLRYH